MIIGTCGYLGTGSSAVTDLLKEYKGVTVIDFIEFVIVYCPDGIEDLDYQLNSHISKHLSSTIAIERFRRTCYFYILKALKDVRKATSAKRAIDEYIESIVQVRWNGFGAFDKLLFEGEDYNKSSLKKLLRKVKMKIAREGYIHFGDNYSKWPMHEFELSVMPDGFLERTQEFIAKIIEIFGNENEEIIVLDQPFLGNDPTRSYKYFNEECKAIVVDRDPRDKYIASKYARTKTTDGFQTPVDDPKKFVEFYKKLRVRVREDDESVLRINMESLIYDYSETVSMIEDFCGIKNHADPQKWFNPSRSGANTQLFMRFPQYGEDIAYIEKALPEYLFPFNEYKKPEIKGDIFFDRTGAKR